MNVVLCCLALAFMNFVAGVVTLRSAAPFAWPVFGLCALQFVLWGIIACREERELWEYRHFMTRRGR